MSVWLQGLYGAKFELENASVQLSDARSGVDYRLSHMALAARVNSQGELRMAGGAQLPAQIGRRVDFVAQLRGVLAPERRWSGRVYVDLKGGRLDTPLLREFLPQLPAVQGVLDARLWTSWKDGLPETVSGHAGLTRFAFSTPAVRNASAAAGTLTWLSADFSWKQTASGWQLAAKQVQAGNARRAWPGSAFSVAESSTSNGRRFYGWSDFLRIQNVVPLLEAQSVLPEELRRRLRGMAPSGDVSALRFDVLLPHEGMPQISASARFANVAVNPQDSVPGVRGASGMVRATSQGGALALDSSSLVLDAPQLFTATPPAAAAKGLVRWALHPSGIVVHGDDLDMSNADFSAHGQFGLWLPSGGRPYLTLLLHMSRGNVAAAHRYLPSRLFDGRLDHWLGTALVGGEVTDGNLILRGDPTRFPFRNHDGVFEARLQVRKGVLAYFENWPQLSDLQGEVVFDGPSLHVDATGGKVLGTRIESARLDIPDIEKARLDISGSGSGPLADMSTYLAYTPLGDGRQQLFKEIRSDGREHVSLHIVLPLSGGDLKNWRLQGTSQVSNGSFALPEQDFALHAINGRFDFTQRSLTAQNVAARFRGQPVRMAATTRPDGLATLTLDGHYTVAGLLGKSSPVTQFAHGEADVRLAFTMPMTPETFRRYGTGILLASDLRNVAVNLPAPLGKKAGQQRGFVLRFSVARPDAPVWLRYGDALQAVLRVAGKGTCRYLAAADVRYDRGTPRLPAQGITLEATVPNIDVDAWRTLQTGGAAAPTATSADCPASVNDVLKRVRSVNVQAGRMRLFGRDFRSVSLGAQRAHNEWQAKVESNVLTGSLQIPVDLRGGAPLRFDLDRVVLANAAPSESSSGGVSFNPAELPPLSGHIARLDIAGRLIDGVNLTTTPLSDGLQIHQLQIDEPNLQARVSGDWRRTGGRERTRVRIELKTDDAGKVLQRLKLSSALNGGKGQATASLDWAGTPFDLSWKRLTGQASLSLGNGRLNEIDPGQTGRLLGLFNLSQLPKRLTLGFGDLFQKGFAFNSIKGDFQFRSGDLYTQNLAIAGASADIGVKGRVGIAARDYDATVTVVPQVDSALPIASAAIGGPAAGAVVFLLDRVFGIGKQINKAAEIKYHVGGSWDAPKITVEKAPQNASNPTNRRNRSVNPY
ncbi:YhdP family protein [Acidihalobacter sp.]|uniref:YhdP family protein n=1 Tax=Acidihalobacter sp. TaxID=1872108 RepID=UPI00307D0648